MVFATTPRIAMEGILTDDEHATRKAALSERLMDHSSLASWRAERHRRRGKRAPPATGVAPDGSLWIPSLLGMQGRDPDLGGGHQTVCGHGTDGVVRFDGETWSRHLQGRCVEAMDIAADGSVWLLATKSNADLAHVYVITSAAVAANE